MTNVTPGCVSSPYDRKSQMKGRLWGRGAIVRSHNSLARQAWPGRSPRKKRDLIRGRRGAWDSQDGTDLPDPIGWPWERERREKGRESKETGGKARAAGPRQWWVGRGPGEDAGGSCGWGSWKGDGQERVGRWAEEQEGADQSFGAVWVPLTPVLTHHPGSAPVALDTHPALLPDGLVFGSTGQRQEQCLPTQQPPGPREKNKRKNTASTSSAELKKKKKRWLEGALEAPLDAQKALESSKEDPGRERRAGSQTPVATAL